MSRPAVNEVEAILAATEEQIAASGTADLRELRFWSAIGAVKRSPELVDRFADRIGAIDQAVFAAWAPITIPLWAGALLAATGDPSRA